MMLRIAKVALVLVVALFYSLVVFNNVTEYDSNYQFVHHVLMMDTTFPGNHGRKPPSACSPFSVSRCCWSQPDAEG